MENNLIKELAPLKAQTSKAVASATALQIKTAEDLTAATDILGKVKKVGAMIKEKKESITKPLNEALKNARGFFAPLEDEWIRAEKIIKDKMLDYQRAEMAKAAVKEEKIVAKVEAGKMSFDKAADKIEAITPPKTVEANAGAAQFKKVKVVVVSDKNVEAVPLDISRPDYGSRYYRREGSIIPDQYWELDMVKVRKVALAGVEIPGIEVKEDLSVAGTKR